MMPSAALKRQAASDAAPDEADVRRLLAVAEARPGATRIELLSRLLLGRPYQPNPLIGSAETPEVFTASLHGFDCVTYIETVLALARARSVHGFLESLRKIRYERGRVQWKRRNHYMTGWIRNNQRERMIRALSIPGAPTVARVRTLNVVPGIAARRMRIKCIPKRAMARAGSFLETGDLIFFVSTRRNLDVFHGGIVVRDEERILMRHASRSKGAVVEQELPDFLNANRMAGVIIARPDGPAGRQRIRK